MGSTIDNLFKLIDESISDETLIGINYGDYQGEVEGLKKILVKPVLIKDKLNYSFVYRYQTKDITKNFSPAETILELKKQFGLTAFRFAKLTTTHYEAEMQRLRNNQFKLKKKPILQNPIDLSHDKIKKRKLESTAKKYLQLLGITNEKGEVKKTGQDKFKQINHYIEILSSLLKELPTEKLNVVDMGSGKGYLTFALYDYLTNNIKKKATIVGVEFRKDLVALCNSIAKASDFDTLSFIEGSIENYNPTHEINLLIALHACDTATDDAIYKGIKNKADLIVVAPCCHKQIRREIAKSKKNNDLDFLMKHGIFLERQAEMVTDGIRALLLEYHGYKTKVIEFISTEHTPKNVLIVAQRRSTPLKEKKQILKKIEDTKSYFGIEKHHLEELFKDK